MEFYSKIYINNIFSTCLTTITHSHLPHSFSHTHISHRHSPKNSNLPSPDNSSNSHYYEFWHSKASRTLANSIPSFIHIKTKPLSECESLQKSYLFVCLQMFCDDLTCLSMFNVSSFMFNVSNMCKEVAFIYKWPGIL